MIFVVNLQTLNQKVAYRQHLSGHKILKKKGCPFRYLQFICIFVP